MVADDLFPVALVHRQDLRLVRCPGRIVYDDVESAPRVEHLFEHRLHVGFDASVGGDGQDRSAGRLDAAGCRLQRVGTARGDRHHGALVGEARGDTPTNAAACASDNCYLAVQSHQRAGTRRRVVGSTSPRSMPAVGPGQRCWYLCEMSSLTRVMVASSAAGCASIATRRSPTCTAPCGLARISRYQRPAGPRTERT